jgi:hypothetical protein
MRVLLALLILPLLSGCVPAPPVRTFASPLDSVSSTVVHRAYLPIVTLVANKRGVSLACGTENWERTQREIETLGVSWIWNWSTNPPVFPGIESIPCVWNMDVIGMPLGGNSEWIIGPNECDQWDQCNTPPEVVAREWPRLIATYPGKKYGSPQVVQPYARWLERFYAAYQDQNNGEPPPMDAILVHTYWGNSLEEYKKQVLYYISLADKWGIDEVWITEFAFAPILDGTLRNSVNEMVEFVAWLESQPKVTRYSIWTNRVECATNVPPDGAFDVPLFAGNGFITTMGQAYSKGSSGEK